MSLTANDAIALFRSYIGVWTYGLGVHDDKDKISDCMYMVGVWARSLGLDDRLGPVLPWNVSYFVAHTTFPHTGPTGAIHKGDILVLGDPKATDVRLKYAHIGVATDPGKYISQYNYGVNVIEKAIDHAPTMQLVLVFWTGFAQPDPVPPEVVMATTYVALKKAVRLLDTRVNNGMGQLTAFTPGTFQVAGRSGIPADAVVVTGNLTVVAPSSGWALALTSEPDASPTTSSINFPAGDTRGNFAITALGTGGKLSLTFMSTPGQHADATFDATGYFQA